MFTSSEAKMITKQNYPVSLQHRYHEFFNILTMESLLNLGNGVPTRSPTKWPLLYLRDVHGNGKDWDPMGWEWEEDAWEWELRRGSGKKSLHAVTSKHLQPW